MGAGPFRVVFAVKGEFPLRSGVPTPTVIVAGHGESTVREPVLDFPPADAVIVAVVLLETGVVEAVNVAVV
jgi:hypothetical protein